MLKSSRKTRDMSRSGGSNNLLNDNNPWFNTPNFEEGRCYNKAYVEKVSNSPITFSIRPDTEEYMGKFIGKDDIVDDETGNVDEEFTFEDENGTTYLYDAYPNIPLNDAHHTRYKEVPCKMKGGSSLKRMLVDGKPWFNTPNFVEGECYNKAYVKQVSNSPITFKIIPGTQEYMGKFIREDFADDNNSEWEEFTFETDNGTRYLYDAYPTIPLKDAYHIRYRKVPCKKSPLKKRCPNGTRRNKKTRLCEKSYSKKRCENGTRRNKKTGLCEKHKKSTKTNK